MNLNDSNDGMVPLYPPAPSQPQQQNPPKVPEKNMPKHQTTMDSTPISDIMQDGPGMMDSQDPRAQYMQQSMMPPPMSASSMGVPQQKQQAASVASKNPMNLTNEQMHALIAGVSSIIAFSTPVQDKLSTTIPQFLSEAGTRSTTGLISTGLLVAILFYFIQRFLNK